jgi:hypothetical protein
MGEGAQGNRHTFDIFLRLLRRCVGVRIVNASKPAVPARVSGVSEVEDESRGCGKNYIARDVLVFCCIGIESGCWDMLFLEVYGLRM